MNDRCIICRSPLLSREPKNNTDKYIYDCIRCGKYVVDGIFESIKKKALEVAPDKVAIAKSSSWIRTHQLAELTDDRLNKVCSLQIPGIGDRATQLLIHLGKEHPKPGQNINIPFTKLKSLLQKIFENDVPIKEDIDSHHLNLLSYCWAEDFDDVQYILHEYLSKTKGYINILDTLSLEISPQGWEFIDSVRSQSSDSNFAFLAMKFDDEIKKYADNWVIPAANNAGYNCSRADQVPHNKLIDDEMLALIRQSKFIIADFTFNNSGVYFEAGFARGLNIDVINICEKTFFEEKGEGVHFDTNHYPFLLYEFDKGKEFLKTLQFHIEATIGKGNYILDD